MKDLILIDNAAYSFSFQLKNGIPISPYYDNKEDHELKAMIPYLKSISKCNDIRNFNRHYLKMDIFTKN